MGDRGSKIPTLNTRRGVKEQRVDGSSIYIIIH